MPTSACPVDEWKKQDGTCVKEFCDACPFACNPNADPKLKGECFDCGCGWCRRADEPDDSEWSCCELNGQKCNNNSPGNCQIDEFTGFTSSGQVCAAGNFLSNLAKAVDVSGTNRDLVDLCSCHIEMSNVNPCDLVSPATPSRDFCYAARKDNCNVSTDPCPTPAPK